MLQRVYVTTLLYILLIWLDFYSHMYYYNYRPDQDLDLLYDYAVQMFKGQYALKIHVAAVNVDKDVQVC